MIFSCMAQLASNALGHPHIVSSFSTALWPAIVVIFPPLISSEAVVIFCQCNFFRLINVILLFQKNSDPGSMDKMYTRQGYLFLMEKSKSTMPVVEYNILIYIDILYIGFLNPPTECINPWCLFKPWYQNIMNNSCVFENKYFSFFYCNLVFFLRNSLLIVNFMEHAITCWLLCCND